MTLSGLHYEILAYCLITLLCLAAALALYLYPKLQWRSAEPSQFPPLRNPSARFDSLHIPPKPMIKEPVFANHSHPALSAQAVGKTILITTDHWFYAPDGKTYRAVFGTLRNVLADSDVLGIKTNARSTNWYLEIGNMVIAGCQIHYAMLAERGEMNFGKVTQDYREGLFVQSLTHEANVYDADRDDADMFKRGISRII